MNVELLRKTCEMAFDDFRDYGGYENTPTGGLIFADRGQKILGVAHLDTVQIPNTQFHGSGERVYSPALDDRLGVHILLHVLPKLGIQFDLLLTDSEEKGQSTGMWFDYPRQYNWIFSFDRAGTDVVMYDYENKEMKQLMESHQFEVGFGTFSDISFMCHLGCKGINFGCGYYHQHTNRCFADLRDTQEMITKFSKFYRENKDVYFKHQKTSPISSYCE